MLSVVEAAFNGVQHIFFVFRKRYAAKEENHQESQTTRQLPVIKWIEMQSQTDVAIEIGTE